MILLRVLCFALLVPLAAGLPLLRRHGKQEQ